MGPNMVSKNSKIYSKQFLCVPLVLFNMVPRNIVIYALVFSCLRFCFFFPKKRDG